MTDIPDPPTPQAQQPSAVTGHIIDAALVIGFVSGAAYLVGYAYFWSFLTGLSIRPEFVGLPTINYMWHAFLAFFMIVTAFMPAVAVARKPHTSFLSAALGNYPVFALLTVIGIPILKKPQSLGDWNNLFIVISITFISIYGCYRKQSIARYLYTNFPLILASRLRLTISVSLLMLLTMIVAFSFGDMHARKLVEGDLFAVSAVKLLDSHGNDILGQGTWILIMIDDSGYYVVQRTIPAPRLPVVRVISKSAVNIVEIHRLK